MFYRISRSDQETVTNHKALGAQGRWDCVDSLPGATEWAPQAPEWGDTYAWAPRAGDQTTAPAQAGERL